MQTTTIEISAVTDVAAPASESTFNIPSNPHSFVLPIIGKEIPIETGVKYHDPALTKLARQLFDIGVLAPSDVPENATSVQQLVQAAFGAWVKKRVPVLNHMLLSAELLRPESAANVLQDCADPDGYSYGYEPQASNGNYALAIRGSHDYLILEMEAKATLLERSTPGLFQTALHAIQLASNITVDIHLPSHFLSEYFNLWEFWDEQGLPSDEEARESLIGHFGDDDSDVEDLLPSQILPMLGGALCLPSMYKAKYFTKSKLRAIAKSSGDMNAVLVAQLTLDLLDAVRKAHAIKAYLPTIQSSWARYYERGCTLVYQYNQRINAQIDDEYQTTMSYGNGTEYLGIEDLPTSSNELKSFFQRLDRALIVLSCMDNLIGQISDPSEPLNS